MGIATGDAVVIDRMVKNLEFINVGSNISFAHFGHQCAMSDSLQQPTNLISY